MNHVDSWYNPMFDEVCLRFKANDIEYNFSRGFWSFGYINSTMGEKSAQDIQVKAEKIGRDYLDGNSGELATWLKLITLTRRHTTFEHLFLPFVIAASAVSIFIWAIYLVIQLETY